VFEIGLRHLSHFITGGFFAVLHASVYSILPSLAGGLGFSFSIQLASNSPVMNKFYDC